MTSKIITECLRCKSDNIESEETQESIHFECGDCDALFSQDKTTGDIFT